MSRRSFTALAVLLVVDLLSSCVDQGKTITGPRAGEPARRAIVDEARGGQPEFFWLPPTVPAAPTLTGQFDATALSQLVVEVCELDAGNGCVAGEPLERFTEDGTPVPQRITVDAVGEFYTVDWLTGPSNVDVERLYRVRVLRNGNELGFIDVEFVKDMPALSAVDPTRYVGVKRGQPLTIRFRIDQPSARTRVRVNEIESSGGVPGDWLELYNTSALPLSLAGYVVRDNDDAHTYTLPAGATIPAQGFYVIDESELGFGLGAADAVRFFAPDGTTLVDSHAWTSHAPSTYGRCPDGTGAFQTTTAVTKGSANDCRVVVVFNEIESSGGTPGDWIELFNPGPAPANIGGFVFKDNDDTHAYAIPAGTIVPAGGYLVLDESTFGFGLGAADAARLFRPDGSLVDSYSWTAHASTTYGRCPDGVGPFITTTSSTKGSVNDCSTPPAAIVINEIESSGGIPGDWVELYNPGATPANISGYLFRDNDDTHAYLIPAGTTVAPGGYYLLEEAAFGFGLGAADAARLYDTSGLLVDSYTWTAHATTTYGRCPNATGAFATTSAATKGTANACVGLVFSPWPGDAAVQTVSAPGAFGGNLSGLTYEATSPATPGVLWAVRNGPGTLYRLVWNGSIYTPDGADGWAAGKTLLYPDGTGNADAEGVTFALGGSTGGMYVAAERNNDVGTVSRNSILRYDVASGSTTLTATREWNLTADLPAVGANLGIEAVTWISDGALVARGFFDEAKGHPYDPAEYANHQGGLFLVGLEANGTIYAYALDHVGGGFTRVATIASGLPAVMALEYDRDLDQLWAVCDNGCAGRSSVLRINAATGRFAVVQQFERPAAMPNLNNEGFAFAPLAECVSGKRDAFWSDDSETDGFSIRRGSVSCSPF